MNHNALDRRNFFKASLLGGAALAMPWSASRALAAAAAPAIKPATAEFRFAQARGNFQKNGQSLDGARIDHSDQPSDQPGAQGAVIGERPGAVDGRMNHHRL